VATQVQSNEVSFDRERHRSRLKRLTRVAGIL
jgi:hypothetical protein